MPEGSWLHGQIETWQPDENYDGAVIWDTLFHVPHEYHASILRRVIPSLKPGAKVMLTVGGSDHPAFTDSMFGHIFFYDSLTPEQTVALLLDLGVRIEHAEFINPPTSGPDKGRYGIVASVV